MCRLVLTSLGKFISGYIQIITQETTRFVTQLKVNDFNCKDTFVGLVSYFCIYKKNRRSCTITCFMKLTVFSLSFLWIRYAFPPLISTVHPQVLEGKTQLLTFYDLANVSWCIKASVSIVFETIFSFHYSFIIIFHSHSVTILRKGNEFLFLI